MNIPWDQIGVSSTCLLVAWLSTYRNFAVRRWSYPLGILAQGFWIWTCVTHNQPYILISTAVFLIIYIRGTYTHWWKGEDD